MAAHYSLLRTSLPFSERRKWGITAGWGDVALVTYLKQHFKGIRPALLTPRPCDQALVSLLTPATLINLLCSLHGRERWGEGERHREAESARKKKSWERRERNRWKVWDLVSDMEHLLSLCGCPGPSYWICMSRVVEEPRAIADSSFSCSEVYSKPSHGEMGLRVIAVWRVHRVSTLKAKSLV